MKKTFLFSLLFLLVLGLTACSRNTNSINNSVDIKRISYSSPDSEPLSEFTTTIYDADDERQTNMTLACDTLSGTIVKAGETFSFNETLGRAKPEDGYEKAEVFESDR